MRELASIELENVAFLTRYGIKHGLLEPTSTGLAKSIMDATSGYRAFLEDIGLHDFEAQLQGQESKALADAVIVSQDGGAISSTATFYRPATKKGDPRVWFYGLKQHCKAGCILASIWFEDALWVVDLSTIDLEAHATSSSSLGRMLSAKSSDKRSVFEELLQRLVAVHEEGYIPVLRNGDTGVGHLIESRLGIAANSRKEPDYKGVELKSSRAKQGRNRTLFARVADWDISPLGSSRAILNEFGYPRDGKDRLNCSISASKPNSQGLQFRISEEDECLEEISSRPAVPVVARWRLDGLIDSLANKHADTFWIRAESRKEGPTELIRVMSVVQTSRPMLNQFAPMLRNGEVTMDHLISRKFGESKVGERGPLFKIQDRHFTKLFPEPIRHDLAALSRG